MHQRLARMLGVSALALGVVVATALLVRQPTTGGRSRPAPATSTDTSPGVTVVTQQAPATQGSAYVSWDIPTPNGLSMMPVVDKGGRLWVGELGERQLTLFFDATGRYTRYAFPTAATARTNGITVDRSGLVWLAQDGRHSIASFDVETRTYREFFTPTPGSALFGIVADADDHIWFTELAGNRIGVYDPHTDLFGEYALPMERLYPYLLALTPDGRVWFTTLQQPSVGVLDPATGEVQIIAVPGVDQVAGTTGIAVGPDGGVWFGIRGGALGRVDPATRAVSVYRSPGSDSYGVAVDARGRVWLASTDAAVYAFEPDTGRFCGVATGDGARWLTVAPDGSVWVAQGRDGSNAVGRISPMRAAEPCRPG